LSTTTVTHTGGRFYSTIKIPNISLIRPTESTLQLSLKRKDLQSPLKLVRRITPHKSGLSSMLTNQRKTKLRDSMKTSVSISTDHSTSEIECHSRELLNALEPTM